MTWSARQYQRFEDERTRPARDLLAALPALDARLAIDIGCGPGNSTELLAARFPHATVGGFDSSAEMIEAARKRLPALQFEIADVAQWGHADAAHAQGPFDVILANAVLQWVPHHAALFPALIAKLARGGALAVQMPDNLSEPAHRLMRELASAAPWRDKLAAAAGARALLEGADWYYQLLRSSCARWTCGGPLTTIRSPEAKMRWSTGSRAAAYGPSWNRSTMPSGPSTSRAMPRQ